MNSLKLSPYLKPGDLYVSNNGEVLRTTVGSCISICLYDSIKRIGGMNHYMYAESSATLSDDKCGDIAIPKLVGMMIREGSDFKNLKATIVGGASSFSTLNRFSAGQKNVNIAKSLLKKEGIPVLLSETGGCHGRKVLFHTETNYLESTILDDCMGHCKMTGKACKFRILFK